MLGMDHLVGSLEVGKRADLITLDRDSLHLAPWNDVYGNLVYAARGADVRNVFVDGRAIVLDRCLLAVDAAELARKVSAMGARLRDLAAGSAERSGQIRERQRAQPNVTMNAVASRAQTHGWQRLQLQILPTWTSPLCTMSGVR